MPTVATPDKPLFVVAKNKKVISGVINKLVESTQAGFADNRRKERRHSLCVAVEAVAFDADGNRSGEPFIVVTRDISASGISLLYTRQVLDRFLLLRFPQSDANIPRIVMEVIRQQRIGSFWSIAGRFLAEA